MLIEISNFFINKFVVFLYNLNIKIITNDGTEVQLIKFFETKCEKLASVKTLWILTRIPVFYAWFRKN